MPGKKITAEMQNEMQEMRSAGVPINDIAAHFGVSKQTVSINTCNPNFHHGCPIELLVEWDEVTARLRKYTWVEKGGYNLAEAMFKRREKVRQQASAYKRHMV